VWGLEVGGRLLFKTRVGPGERVPGNQRFFSVGPAGPTHTPDDGATLIRSLVGGRFSHTLHTAVGAVAGEVAADLADGTLLAGPVPLHLHVVGRVVGVRLEPLLRQLPCGGRRGVRAY